MSENRDRRTDRFSKYDSMPTEALEEILRLDAEAPEEQESDTELLLYVMGVLANRRNTDITGNKAQEAWESFQKDYLDEECLEDMQEPKKNRTAAPWLRRLIAAAALITLVACLPLSANAFGWEDIWNVFARWAKETFSFVSSESAEISEPSPTYREDFSSLQEMLENSDRESDFIPTWIPDGFVLKEIDKHATPSRENYSAFYIDGEKELSIRVQTYMGADSYKVEIGEDVIEIYEISGIKYYIFENMDQIRFVWNVNSYECNVSGDLSIEEAKRMIDSIGKG